MPAEIVKTLAEIAAHNSPSDCWVVIHGQVYDVTEFLTRHPGGAQRECGFFAFVLGVELLAHS